MGLWRFSLRFYALPGVAAALLGLQDRAGLDVNLILYALWLGVSGRGRLDCHRLAAAQRAVSVLQTEVTGPLRAMRRQLKPHPDTDVQVLRERVKALELASERAAQARLAALPAARPTRLAAAPPLAAADANLTLCLGPVEAGSAEAAVLREAVTAHLQGASAGSPQRRTVPVSKPKRSSTRPKV
jgi:uncharacterized protein (TIGR02444 family)